jgi:hypothetical protein
MYDWVGELTNLMDDPEGQVELFDEVINNISNNFIPHEEKTFYAGDPPWLTKNCKNFYKKYNRFYNRYARRGYPPAEKARVEALKNEYATMVTAAKDSYMKRLGSEVSNPRTGQKKYWTALKKLINKSISTVIPPILHDNTLVTDAHKKGVIFNNYLKNQCTLLNTNSVLPAFERKTPHSISAINISQNQISILIKKLNVNKSHGHDGLSARMLQMYGDTLTVPLSIIYTNCISKGYFPKKWKRANVTPVHKKNAKNIVSNYRPISLLPLCGKIFEKIIYDNMYTHFFGNKLISDKQSGYRRNDSTIKQLLSITHKIYKAFDDGEEIRAVFLDISRAFDRVWHDGIIFKLRQMGVEGDTLNILTSFLANREQRVVLDGQTSEWGSVEAGVPQGSILGPLLFLVYINDLIEVVESDINIFADDTFIFHIIDQFSTQILNSDLEKITNWANQWKMSFNPDITKQAIEIIFSNKNVKSNPPPSHIQRHPC